MIPEKSNVNAGIFRKRVLVRAHQYNGSEPFIIHTLEGDMTAMPGDWIITGVAGERYACRDDIFRASYQRIDGQLLSLINRFLNAVKRKR